MSQRSATSGDGIAGDSQVPPAPTQEGELIVGQQSGHPRECIISFGQWAVAFLDVAERANSNPQALTCPICGSSFLYWKRGLESFKYAGELEGTVMPFSAAQAVLKLHGIQVQEAMSTNQESEGQHGVSNIEPDPANHNDDDSLIDLHPHSDDPHRGIDLRKPAFLRTPTGSGISYAATVATVAPSTATATRGATSTLAALNLEWDSPGFSRALAEKARRVMATPNPSCLSDPWGTVATVPEPRLCYEVGKVVVR